MTSVVITGKQYLVHPELADKFGPFSKTYLADGDSWMDASAAAQGSLPFYLTQEFNRLGETNLIINISTSGQTLQKIGETMQGDYANWLKWQAFDGILFSAGGNDFIDAARDVPPGQGLLFDMAGKPTPANGADCMNAQAVAKLVNDYLNPNFEVMYQALRNSTKNASTPMFLNSYEVPVARNAPVIQGLVGPWLYTAFNANHIPSQLWPALTTAFFQKVSEAVVGWETGRVGVTAIPSLGTLTPASPTATGSSGDWKNEIHPNASGWKKLAKHWAQQL